MQRLELSGAVRLIYRSLGVKRLMLKLYTFLRNVFNVFDLSYRVNSNFFIVRHFFCNGDVECLL